MKQFLSRYYTFAVIALWAVLCFVFFQFFYSYHFFYKEQSQVFLLTWNHAASYFERPAWLACLAGDFLTQFYYYLYAGAVILTFVLLTMGDLMRRGLQQAGIGKNWAFWIAILAITLEAVCHLRVSYHLSSTIALTGGAAIFFIGGWMLKKQNWLTVVYIIGATMLSYWMFGIGVWIFAILLLIWSNPVEWVKKPMKWAKIAGFIPLIFVPLIIAVGRNTYLLTPHDALTYPGIGKMGKPDFILENDFAVDNEYNWGNYNRVEQLVEQSKDRTYEMLFFYNLIQAQKGLLPDKLLQFYPNELGTFYRIGPSTPRLIINNMNELYWALGDITFTERAALMKSVFSPQNRDVRMLKRLAECNIVSGDTAAAEKYLRILDNTLAYRKWAKAARIDANGHYREKRALANRKDTIALTDNAHFIMMQLLDSNPDNTAALDYILCSDLLLKDIANFKRDYDRYCENIGRPRPKKIYQEALCIWLAGSNAPAEEWQRYIVREDVIQQFKAYNMQRGSTRFSDTYWYYFDKRKAPKPEE